MRIGVRSPAGTEAPDGYFVYVALTTKIYCRPSCPARLPQRERVIILPTAAEAERRGYSACRRCHPGANALAPAEKSIQLALEFIEGHLDTPLNAPRPRRQASGLSPKHLQRVFTRMVGLSPKAFGDFRRLARVKALLRDGVPVTTAAYEAGYGSLRALYERAERGLGMTPAEYQRGGAGAHIRDALAEVSLGVAVRAARHGGGGLHDRPRCGRGRARARPRRRVPSGRESLAGGGDAVPLAACAAPGGARRPAPAPLYGSHSTGRLPRERLERPCDYVNAHEPRRLGRGRRAEQRGNRAFSV